MGSLPRAQCPPVHGGGYALIEGAWAILGLDSVEQVLALLERRMHDALAEAGYAEGPEARVVAETLVSALTDGYRFEEPGDVETLERLGAQYLGKCPA